MYRAFNIVDIEFTHNREELRRAGLELRQKNAANIMEVLQNFLAGNSPLDGSLMQGHWFPQIEADVFISYAHTDDSLALMLAGWLSQELGLRPFVDSSVWGNASDLLKAIDDKYCLLDGGPTYNYQSRNGSTSHVHMMLATALAKMIDSTECIWFLNTKHSITSKEAVERTKSPWIFFELATIDIVRPRLLADYRPLVKKAEAQLDIYYEVPLSSLTAIDATLLNEWRRTAKRPYPLDRLYELA
jgi:hypothetical protein